MYIQLEQRNMAPQLPTRKIGNDVVTATGFGAMGLSAFYGKPLPDEDRLKVRLCLAAHRSFRTY